MTSHTTTPCLSQSGIETTDRLFDNWFDPIETGLRERVRGFLQAMLEAELDDVLARPRYARKPRSADSETPAGTGHRHGHRPRSLLGTFGRVTVAVPRARLNTTEGGTTEWKSRALGQVIQQWSNVMSVERFLAGVEQRAAELPETDRAPVLERLKLAREFLGTQDPLDFFLSWKTPVERYRPRYAESDFDSETDIGPILGDEGEQECDSSEGSL